MTTLKIGIIGALSGAVLLSACAATESTKDRTIFLRSNLAGQAYSGDLTSCDDYVTENGASEGEKGGAVIAGFLLGGIMGAASTGSAYEKSQNRLFEECMFGKGYTLIPVPEDVGSNPRTEDGGFDRRQAALELIEKNQADELFMWQNAKRSGNPERIQAYLAAYPEGLFAGEALTLLKDDGKEKKAKTE